MKLYRRYFKRTFDVIFSLLLLILLSPIFLIVSILIIINLGKPVIFRQDRPGLNGEIFIMRKFRSMTNITEDDGILLSDEVRLTRFGKILRASSLDELPELVNILKGDMSFVGPRPLLPQYLALYNEVQRKRHDVRPGLTGLAQVNGRNSITWEGKFEKDIEYIDTCSFINDIKILIKTIIVVIRRDGVSQANTSTSNAFTGTGDV